jgi:hypothetical protein
MNPYTYIISLRAKHPTSDLSFLTSLLCREPSACWLAGEERKTPKGTLLGGVRESSYWAAQLKDEETESENWPFEDFLEK